MTHDTLETDNHTYNIIVAGDPTPVLPDGHCAVLAYQVPHAYHFLICNICSPPTILSNGKSGHIPDLVKLDNIVWNCVNTLCDFYTRYSILTYPIIV